MTTNNLDFKEVETFLNANPDFLGTFLARNEQSKNVTKKVMETTPPPTLTMSKCVEKLVNQQRIKKKKIIAATMSENQRFSEFVKDIAGELNVDALSHKILQNVITLTGSDRGRLFLVEETDEKYLVSKLFDVTATSQLDDTMLDETVALRVPFGKGIAGTVAESRVSMNIKEAQDDPRFDPDIDGLAGYEIRCILCMPILNKESDVVGVAEIMNKQGIDHFSEQDEILFTEYLNFCGIGINNARLFQMSIEEIHKNQLLLNLAWQISIGQSNTDQIIKIILEHALQIIKCKFAKVYLLDTKGELFSKIYRQDSINTEITIAKNPPADVYSVIAKESLDSNQNIFFIDLGSKPDLVAANEIPSGGTNGDKMKIYEEGANWILCTPIHNPSDECIGCIMFAGKTKSIRNESDANSVEAFAVYCGLGIYNCQLYETTVKSLTSKQVIMEILSYHMTSEKEEVNRFVNLEMPSTNECNIYDIGFDNLVMSDVATVQMCALIFIKMNALNILGITLEHLYHWILTVKKNYKPLLYHNWRHALNVSQTMFCTLSSGSSKKFFSPFECICLLVASLCHDLDYQGLASAQNLKSTSLLATVYSTSSSEHQVLGRCIMILNAEATNIFQNLTAEKYREAMELIKRAIISTDIYVYLLNVDYFEELKKKERPFKNEHDKEMIMSLTMVSCDLTAFSKPWSHHKILVLAAVLDLFQPHESGAPWLSKNELNDIPRMMVDFIDVICLKAFETMTHFDAIFARLYDACSENRKNWENIAQQIDEFDVENELNKSRAGFIDFDEDMSSSIGGSARSPDLSIPSASGGAKDMHDEKKEKERKEELEAIECEIENESMRRREQEEKEKEEKEQKEREEKEEKAKEEREREEKELKEKEEKAKKEREQKDLLEREEKQKREKEQKELEEKEKQEKVKKAREETERKEREEKEKEEKETKEKEEKEKKEKEEADRQAKEEKEEEKKKKEMEEKKKKDEEDMKKKAEEKTRLVEKKKENIAEENEGMDSDNFKHNVKEQLMARMSDKLINLKSPPPPPESPPPASSSQDESRSTISPSPTESPTPKLRRLSKELQSPDVLVARRLSYRQPDEKEIVIPPKRQMTRRKSCIEEMAEENMRHKNEKKIRRPSITHISPDEGVKHSPAKSPPNKPQEKITKQKSTGQPKKADSPLQKRPSLLRSESAQQRIKANTVHTGKRKCAPKAAEKDNRKKVQKSSLCAII